MPYHLKARETLSNGIKRIAEEELSGALRGLRGSPTEGDVGTVHDTRKRFKKLRAVLRLLRSDLGKKRYRQAQVLLRDAGRELSGLRDAQVLSETLEALAKRFPDEAYQSAFSTAQQSLAARQPLVPLETHALMEGVAAKVATLEAQIVHWPISNDWDSVEPNLARTYEHGLAAFKNAYRHPSDESFHEWRKGVKNLWYHLRILNPLWPKIMKELAGHASRLADSLGDEHDLAVLAQTLSDEYERFSNASELKTILRLIGDRREELRTDAWLLGKRLYADEPEQFISRLGAYWQIWRKENKNKRRMKSRASA